MKKSLLAILLLCTGSLCVQAQSAVKVPAEFCGCWQDVNWRQGAWNGPIITPEYIHFFYQIYYVDNISTGGDGQTTFYLHNNQDEKRTLTVTPQGADTLIYRFTGWDDRPATRVAQHTGMEKTTCPQLPDRLFTTRWTPEGKDSTAVAFHRSGRVDFQGSAWNIREIRRDRTSGQYELLLNDAGRYKLLFARSVSAAFLDLASELRNYPMFAAAADPDLYRILGAWTDKATNEWVYGFFENFAVYRNAFWNYDRIDFKKNKAEIVLNNGNESVLLKLTLDAKADSVCRIAAGKGKKQAFVRYTRLPDYTAPDTATFRDTGYRIDSVTITGYFRGVDFRKPVEFSISGPSGDFQDRYYAQPDSFGRFRIVVPVLNSCEAFIDWARLGLHTVLEPGESIFLYEDFSRRQGRFMGKNARFHQEMELYSRSPQNRQTKYYTDSYNLDKPHSEFHYRQVRLYQENQALYNTFLAQHPYLSERFKTFRRHSALFGLGSMLLQRRFALDRNTHEPLPAEYMHLPDSLFAHLPRPYSLTGLDFVKSYLEYYHQLKDESSLALFPAVDGVRYLQQAGRLTLTPQQEADLKTFEKGLYESIELFRQKADSATLAARMVPYSGAMQRLKPLMEDSLFTNFIRNEWQHVVQELMESRWLQRDFSTIDSLCADPVLREIIATDKFVNGFEDNRRTLYPATLSLFRERVKNPAFIEQVMKRQRYYEELNRQDLTYIESLKRTDHLAGSRDADSLFLALTEPYRGKVLYVDFWGTWCGPCKDQMKYVGAIKDKLKDEDVIFMYFADRSPEVSWKNIIKEFRLTGPNVVHYNLPDPQQELLKRRLGISSYPTYMLIDKQGRIVTMNAPRPENAERLFRAIGELLRKE